MAASVVCRKRPATPFSETCKRTRCSGDAAAAPPPNFVFDHVDAMLLIFPGADRHILQEFFEKSGRCLNAAVASFRDMQVRSAAASDFARAALADRADECAAIFVQQLAAASDTTDAKNRASWLLDMFKGFITSRADATESLRGENGELKRQVEALLCDATVLKRAVAIQHSRQRDGEENARELEHLKMAVSEYQKTIKEMEMENYALSVQLRNAECRSAVAASWRPHPDVF